MAALIEPTARAGRAFEGPFGGEGGVAEAITVPPG